MAAPFLLENPKVGEMFPNDAIERAKKLLKDFKGGIGAYSDSKGNLAVRQDVAQFIHERDGHPSDPEVIICTSSHMYIYLTRNIEVQTFLSPLVQEDKG